jgi:hypothetical protein
LSMFRPTSAETVPILGRRSTWGAAPCWHTG